MNKKSKTCFKSFLLSACLLLLLSANIYGQQRWSIGPRVGANLSNFMGDVSNNKFLPGWSVGGFIMYSDINHFGVSGDILFSQKGAKYEGVINGRSYAYNQRINYLEIPVLARYFLTLSGKFRPNVFVGPAVAFKLNAKMKKQKFNNVESNDTDNSEQFRPADLGVTGGFAFNWEIAKGKRVLIDARYTLGLADVTLTTGSVRNSAVTLNLSYGFGIGKKYGRK